MMRVDIKDAQEATDIFETLMGDDVSQEESLLKLTPFLYQVIS